MVSGFLSHSVDGVIFDACRRAGVRVIRVNRGRPGIVVRTLGRVLVYGPRGKHLGFQFIIQDSSTSTRAVCQAESHLILPDGALNMDLKSAKASSSDSADYATVAE
jgi:hypothetical protein